MKGYVNIPNTIYVRPCKTCGTRPIIALDGENGYTVKCPVSNNHYATLAGTIDIEDWNLNNKNQPAPEFNFKSLPVFHI